MLTELPWMTMRGDLVRQRHQNLLSFWLVNNMRIVTLSWSWHCSDGPRDKTVRKIADTHRTYDSLLYPLMFPRGENGYITFCWDGWIQQANTRKRRYQYRNFKRLESFITDMTCLPEFFTSSWRFSWISWKREKYSVRYFMWLWSYRSVNCHTPTFCWLSKSTHLDRVVASSLQSSLILT